MKASSAHAWARCFDRNADAGLDETERDARVASALRTRIGADQDEASDVLRLACGAAVDACAQGVIAQAVDSGTRTASQEASVAHLLSVFADWSAPELAALAATIAAVQSERA